MMKTNRKGFTIIELMAVVAIIGILLSIVMTAAANSIKVSRQQQAKAICRCVQQGLDTYRAQYDRWPGSLGQTIASGNVPTRSNTEGANNQNDADKYVLDATQVKDMIKVIVEETVMRGNPMLDVSGLFVSRDAGESNGRASGLYFREAVRGTRESRKKMSIGEMNFGYPESTHGWFRRLKITYSVPTDAMEVSL